MSRANARGPRTRHMAGRAVFCRMAVLSCCCALSLRPHFIWCRLVLRQNSWHEQKWCPRIDFVSLYSLCRQCTGAVIVAPLFFMFSLAFVLLWRALLLPTKYRLPFTAVILSPQKLRVSGGSHLEECSRYKLEKRNKFKK